jgi:hypothetical protein
MNHGSGLSLRLMTPPSPYDGDTSPAELGRRTMVALNCRC